MQLEGQSGEDIARTNHLNKESAAAYCQNEDHKIKAELTNIKIKLKLSAAKYALPFTRICIRWLSADTL